MRKYVTCVGEVLQDCGKVSEKGENLTDDNSTTETADDSDVLDKGLDSG